MSLDTSPLVPDSAACLSSLLTKFSTLVPSSSLGLPLLKQKL